METPKLSSDSSCIGEGLLHRIPTPLRNVFAGDRPASATEGASQLKEHKEPRIDGNAIFTPPSDTRLMYIILPIVFVVALLLLACAPVSLLLSSGASTATVPASNSIEPALTSTLPHLSPQPNSEKTSASGPSATRVTTAATLAPTRAPEPERTTATSDTVAANLSATMEGENGTELIQQMWRQGQVLLGRSSCHDAEKMFSSALRLLDEEIGNATSEHNLPRTSRKSLESDRAIALICTSRFEAAAQVLGRDADVLKTSSVHLNALGYAHHMLKDYHRAGASFAAALKADPLNSITWSNFAAARLLVGDIEAADEAMYHALDPDIVRFHNDPRLNRIFLLNVNIIAQHAIGQTSQHPLIELWYVPN